MCPVWVCRVKKAVLGVERVRDAHPKFCKSLSFGWLKRHANRGSIHHNKAVPAKSRIDRNLAKSWHIQPYATLSHKRGQVLDMDALSLAVLALCTHTHEPAWGFEDQLRLRLGHWNDPAVQEHG